MLCRTTVGRMGAAAARAAAAAPAGRAAMMQEGRPWALADRLLKNDEFAVRRHDLHAEVEAGQRSTQAAMLDDFFVPSRAEDVAAVMLADAAVATREARSEDTERALLDDFFLPAADAVVSEAALRDSDVARAAAPGSVASALLDDFFLPSAQWAVSEALLRDSDVAVRRGGAQGAKAAALDDCFVPLRAYSTSAHVGATDPVSDSTRIARQGALADRMLADDLF